MKSSHRAGDEGLSGQNSAKIRPGIETVSLGDAT